MKIDDEHKHYLYAQTSLHMQSLVEASAAEKFPECRKNYYHWWMHNLQFYIILTVFQSYQDDKMLIMEGCMQQISIFSQNWTWTANSVGVTARLQIWLKVADLNFGCPTFCALPSFGAVAKFSSHTTFPSHKVSVKGSDTDTCSAIYFLFNHNTKYCTIYLCPHTVVATV